jgi:hypothetical protein
MFRERRTAQRRPARFFLNAIEDGIPMLCVARDISSTGARLERVLDRRQTSPDSLRLEFKLPGLNRVMITNATCVRGDENARSFGVKFTSLSAADQALISRYLTTSPA